LETIGNNFLSPKKLADYLGLATGTVYHMIARRAIPFYKFGKSVRFSLQEINQWIEKKKTPSSFDFKKKF